MIVLVLALIAQDANQALQALKDCTVCHNANMAQEIGRAHV